MITEKLYYLDNNMSEFDAVVVDCKENNKGIYEVILDKTAFFPEEGGQYADTGMIDNVRVIGAKEKYGVITHFTNSPLTTGITVHCKLDFGARYAKMQCHSAEHIVSGLISKHYSLNNVGFHLGNDDVTLDFDGMLTLKQLDEIEALANEVVYSNIPIRCEFPDSEELKNLDYRSKIELNENVRIVTIEDIDICACCAPHVSMTGEIGIIKLLDFMSYKGGIRIHMLAGVRALEDYKDRYFKCREISNMLSVKQEAICDGVSRVMNEVGKLKGEISALRRAHLDYLTENLTKSDSSIIIFDSILTQNEGRILANTATAFTDSFVAVFCDRGDGSYIYIITAKAGLESLVMKVSETLKEHFSAKGGGKGLMLSGNITADKDDILKALS